VEPEPARDTQANSIARRKEDNSDAKEDRDGDKDVIARLPRLAEIGTSQK
jgi:hypothetical protein